MSLTQTLRDYYANLLIIQYNNQPNAKATIQNVVEKAIATSLPFDVRDGFSIDTAVGKQLDVIGKYVGIDRSFKGQNFTEDYFSLVEYSESSPYASNRKGFKVYSEVDDDLGDTLTYADIISKQNLLNDADYRTLIKLKILQNHTDVSNSKIDLDLFNSFGEDIIPDSVGNMKMLLFVKREISTLAQVGVEKGVIPKPAGVQIDYLVKKNEDMFSLASYNQQDAVDGFTGFTTQNDFDTESGEVLTYNKLEKV